MHKTALVSTPDCASWGQILHWLRGSREFTATKTFSYVLDSSAASAQRVRSVLLFQQPGEAPSFALLSLQPWAAETRTIPSKAVPTSFTFCSPFPLGHASPSAVPRIQRENKAELPAKHLRCCGTAAPALLLHCSTPGLQ